MTELRGVTGPPIANVLYVLPKPRYFADSRRGRVTHALGVARGLAESGVRVVLLSGRGVREYGSELPAGVTIVEVPVSGGMFGRFLWYRALARQARALLEGDPSLRVTIVRYAMSSIIAMRALAHARGNGHLVYEVNSLFYHQENTWPLWVRRAMLGIELAVLRRADQLYVVAEGMQALLAGFGFRPERIAVAPNAGDADLASLKLRPAAAGRSAIRFAYLGIFQEYYELELLVAAYRAVRASGCDVRLEFFGTGPTSGSVMRLAADDSSVHFHGRYVLREVVADGRIDSDTVLMLPYRRTPICEVGSPTKLFEYMALGLPIVASDVGQPAQLLGVDKLALIYEAGNVQSLAAAMRAIAGDARMRGQLGLAARTAFLTSHTWQARMATLHTTLVTRMAATSRT